MSYDSSIFVEIIRLASGLDHVLTFSLSFMFGQDVHVRPATPLLLKFLVTLYTSSLRELMHRFPQPSYRAVFLNRLRWVNLVCRFFFLVSPSTPGVLSS